jgi:sugar phosphate isomerase/epimerase
MFTSRTGNLPIGFRRGWAEWQRDLDTFLPWAKTHGFSFIDLGRDADKIGKQVLDAGLRIGSADLPEWNPMFSPDLAKRADAIAKNAAYIAACSALGIRNYFIVILPADPNAARKDNFKYMVESFNQLGPIFDRHESRLVIEGWPGPGALCCTPETYRAAIKACNSKSIGINFDPSHLLRMHIDPIRFVEEFADRIYHVHGKDTEFLVENVYEYGCEQPPTFGTPRGFGGMTWRYTIPGHGAFRWNRCFEILVSRGYKGLVSIELEDANFNGTTAGEQAGLLASAQYLASC